jgi:hypothetical protein
MLISLEEDEGCVLWKITEMQKPLKAKTILRKPHKEYREQPEVITNSSPANIPPKGL